MASTAASKISNDDASARLDRLVGGDDQGKTVRNVVFALLLHAGFAYGANESVIFAEFGKWLSGFQAHVRDRVLEEYQVDIIKDEPKPPEPEKEPEPVAEKEPPKAEPKDTPPAPPAAAAAAQVIAAPADPNKVEDMTGFTIVQGAATAYTGGSTMAAGTATTMVTAARPAATGVVGGTGTQGPSAVDRSRALRLRGGRDWQCPFPAEADVEQIDSAAPVIEVSAAGDGRIVSVRVISDPGHGFGREARACAMRQGFDPALDREGNGIAATKQFRVGFHR
jgi:periplasmic protein TonB